MPRLFEPLRPLAQQWDPYADHACWMLIFAGPTKVDLCFFDEPREWAPPYEVRADTLEAIDRHFWDWILWVEQKRRGGDAQRVRDVLVDLYELMLRPMGAAQTPQTVPQALAAYLGARDRLERELGMSVRRTLEDEVRPVIEGG